MQPGLFLDPSQMSSHGLICSVVQFPIFHHINFLSLQTATLTSKLVYQDCDQLFYDYILL